MVRNNFHDTSFLLLVTAVLVPLVLSGCATHAPRLDETKGPIAKVVSTPVTVFWQGSETRPHSLAALSFDFECYDSVENLTLTQQERADSSTDYADVIKYKAVRFWINQYEKNRWKKQINMKSVDEYGCRARSVNFVPLTEEQSVVGAFLVQNPETFIEAKSW
ncbi:hypothetical protein [Thalassospira sp.]|uniref:hypothetical protein n=1 Tax=Thalassospira sp. TaxID=1912094 RepID=UPI000C5EFFCC|nr:hypothetical protein [Thalassospira sp.]MBC06506.1 hypothetical protein [Thalassospira sp.]|tara:strand:- start:7666 stop:8154 length:489 start_codon:yes stop_codon:yes gene_type:complete